MASFKEYRSKLLEEHGIKEDQIKKSTSLGKYGNFMNYRQKLLSSTFGDIDLAGVRSWFEEGGNTIQGLSDYYTANEGKWVSNYGADYTESIANLRDKASAVGYYLKTHKDDFEDYASLEQAYKEYVKYFDEAEQQNSNLRSFYSQFGSEDEYNTWLDDYNKYDVYFSDIDSQKAEKGWQKYLTDEAKAKANSPSFTQEALTRNFTISSDNPFNVAFNSMVYDYQRDNSDERPNDSWTQEQKNAFGQLYLESPEKAYAFARETNKRANTAKEDAQKKQIAANATKNLGAAIGSNALAYGINYLGLGMADVFNNAAKVAAGKPLGDDGFISPGEYARAVRSGTSEYLNDVSGTINGHGLGDLYSLGTSILDSWGHGITEKALGTSFQVISSFAQGAPEAMESAKARGASDEMALLYGSTIGVLDTVFEKMGIDSLVKMGSASSVKGLIKNIAKQGFTEGLEELGTAVATEIVDAVMMQDKSEYNLKIAEYMAQGMTEEEASKRAFRELVDGVAYEAVAGAVSGGISGSVWSGVQTGMQNRAINKAYGGRSQSLVSDALTSTDSNVKSVAARMQNKLDKGKKLSGWNLNELITTQDKSKIKSAVEARLTELGETDNVSKVADAIAKQAMGYELTALEKKAINDSKYGYRVVTEADADNVGSGSLANKWAESIGTVMYNAEAYNQSEKPVATKSTPKTETATEAENKASVGEVNANIKSVSVKDGKAVYTLANGETVDADKVGFASEMHRAVADIATDKLTNTKGFTEEAATAMIKGYDGSVNPSKYEDLFMEAFNVGAEGKAASTLNSIINAGVSERTAFTAYELGKNSVLQNESKSDIIETDNAEAKNESGNSIHLRGSVQRNNGENSEGQLPRVEKDSGKTEGRRDSSRSTADEEATRLVHEGREVTVADLGIPGGSKYQKIYRLEGVEETKKMEQARRRAEKRGLVVRFFAGDNLMIETNDGRIENIRGYIQGKYVYIRADHPYYTADQIMRHELGHDMVAKGEISIKKVIERLTELVGEENVEAVLDNYAEAYGKTGLNEAEIWEEIVCDSLGDMNIFAGDKVISEFMAPMLKDIKQATQETKGEANQTRGSPEGVTEGKASFAGIGAESADFDSLRLAQEMTMNGADSEQVRQETGWFRSYDGKWRFEIDDSTAEWHLDTAKPDGERLFKFGEKIFKLGDLLDHPDLFAAYPQLKDVKVWENPDAKTSGYVVGRSTDAITVQSLSNTNLSKDILIHEIQHLIQNIEGFASGASIEQFSYKAWGEKEYAAYEKRNEIASKIYPTLRRHGVSITKADISAVRTAFEINDSIIEYNWMLVGSIADNNPKIAKLFDEYNEQVQILNLTTPLGQYHAVPGEIEAFDAQARRRMTAEERKNTRPNIDRTDVIMSGDSGVSYFAKTSEEDSTKRQLREHSNEINSMEPVADVTYKVIDKRKAKDDAALLYKRSGDKIDRQNFGIIELGKNELNESSNYLNTSEEFAAWMTIPRVLKRGKIISGHENHKGGGFPTYTIAAPVIINGKRGNVAVVVKKTGKYRYKVHRILMPDGSRFVYEKIKSDAEPTGSDIANIKASKGPDISSASKTSLTQNSHFVNSDLQKTSENLSKKFASPEEAKMSGEVSDAKFSIEFADDIANKQRKFVADGLSRISAEELEQAIADTAHMVEEMKPYANILPQDKVGKTLVKNGSYDVSVENTTVCIRTLAYNSFVDMVSEKVGRPLTQMESFLVSQKLYEIAKEPQCLYCYVSLDRKAFNEMVIRYTEQRDAAIKVYEEAGKPKVPSSFNAEWGLFKEFLDGRKPTKNMWDRYVGWINAYNKGERLVSLADISTEAKRLELVEAGGEMASQVKDMLKYAQSASWAKKQTQYVAYYDEILKLKPAVIRNLNSHYGMRWYSFSDYSGAFIVENMQQITDAAIRGLKGLSYTKDTDFAEIFAPTGMNINISVYAKKDGKGGYEIDAKQSANIDDAIRLRSEYPNVGIVVVATDAAGVEWALEQEWSDVVIPFHTVRTGADVAEFYNWEIFNAEQSDTVSDQNLWDAYVNSVGKKKASKMVYPSEHQNNQETYLRICEERGLTPRFKSFLNNPNYMKLVNETRQSEGQTRPLKAEFNLEAAEKSFDKFVEKGGYYEGWYNDGIDVDNEADIVASDVRAGRKANEVEYGRQDVDFDAVRKGRKDNRQHGKASRELDLIDYINEQSDERVEIDGTLTNREILANALESTVQNEVEAKKLTEYKEKIVELNKQSLKLAEIKKEIKELTFGKGEKNPERLAQLKEEARKTENRIHFYDRKLLQLESTNALKGVVQREKTKAYKRAAEKAKESRHKMVEGRRKSEARGKIKSLKQKFQHMLEQPTERQYVPAGLVSAMVKVCEMVDTSTDLYKADGSINKAQQARNEQMQRLLKLQDEYDKIKKNPDAMIAEEYDEEIAEYLNEIRQNYEGKNIADMTLDELTELYRTMKAIEETLRDARKLIGVTEAESVYDAADSIIEEQRNITSKRKDGKRSFADKAMDNIDSQALSPLRAVLKMAGYNEDSMLYKLMRDIENGEREAQKFVMDASKAFEALTTGENADNYEDAIYKPYGKELIDKNGKKFHVSKMQMMQAIMSYEREQANSKLHHVSKGGFSFADIDLLAKGKLKDAISAENAHTVTLGSNAAIEFIAELANDKWAQAYMAEARKFFDETAKEAINDANMTLKHRIVATGSNYIPYEVNKDYVVREITAENDIQQVISGYGMLKDLKDGATQPIIITGLNNILGRHIEQVSKVHGLAVPIRNFNKVWNVKASDGSTTVQEQIGKNWGDEGKEIVTQAVKDVQGARISRQPDWYRTLKGNYIGGVFLLNGSVIAKQVGSMFSAVSMIKYRNPASMLANLATTFKNYDTISAEVDKYTAAVWMRRQGLSDAELYTFKTEAQKSKIGRWTNKKVPTALNPSKWITAMDSAVALSLWKYCKEDVASRTGLTGEELNRETAKYFEDVVQNTQSMSDSLHRPEIQKSDNVASEILGMFKTDLYQGAGQLRVAYGKWKANPTQENKTAFARTVVSSLSSMGWGALMTSLFALLRYKVNPYRDDEDDELTFASWIKVAGADVVAEMVGYLFPLFGSEVAGTLFNIAHGDTVDDLDSVALTAVNDLVDAITTISNNLKEGEMPSIKAYKAILTKMAALFGVPASNVIRAIEAIKLHAQDIANGEFFSFEAGLTKPNAQRLYNAYVEGNEDKIKKASRLYKTQKDIETALRKALRENDPRVKEAAEAYNDGDLETYERIISEIVKEGHFNSKLVSDAVKAEANNLAPSSSTTEEETDKDKAYSIYQAKDINTALDKGDTAYAKKIIDELVKTKQANGMTEKNAKSSVKSSITSYWKPLYVAAYEKGNKTEMSRIRFILRDCGLYGNADEIVATVNSWVKN